MGNNIKFSFLILLYLLSNGCSHSKHLLEGEYLVTETKVEFAKNNEVILNKKTKLDLNSLAQPKPNSGYFKTGLWVHRLTQKRKEKGFKNYLHRKVAKEPSLYDNTKANISQLKMEKYLLDHGYLRAEVTIDTTQIEKTVAITFKVDTKQRHKIRSIKQVSDSTNVGQVLLQSKTRSKLKVGGYYSKQNIDSERSRLSNYLKGKGFINISEENFFFTVDSQFVESVVDISINYKPSNAAQNMTQYKLGATYIHSQDGNKDLESENVDTVLVKTGMYDLQYFEILRPKVLDLTIDQDSSDYISLQKQNLTQNHFLSYGLFKYVNQKYSNPYGDSLDIIDRHIYLTPGPDANIGTGFELNNRSGNFFGNALTSSFRNLNTFKGAEVFNISLTLGSEFQFNTNQNLLNTLLADFNVGLDVPRLLVPFLKIKPSTYYIPHTKFNFTTLLERRLDTYTALRSSFNFSYQWRETRKSNHLLSPVSLSYLDILNTTSSFEMRLDSVRRLALSLQDIIDLGFEYNYTFTDQNPNSSKNYSYLNIDTRVSGNFLNAIVKTRNAEGNKTLFDIPFSQYYKLHIDYRYYIPFRKSKLVSRINTGIAYAYGNAEEVPYNEQFIVGGSQSLRGFDLRGLGPGNYAIEDPSNDSDRDQNYDQTGDILLEMNLEYRFDISEFLKGAVFLDAGNVWLINPNPVTPGGLFQADTFLKQIALNAGYGFRFNIKDIVLVRTDLGLVLRRAYVDDGFDWTMNRDDAFEGQWWKNNLKLQVGLGYPF